MATQLAEQIMIGSLMKNPTRLLEVDKYQLGVQDFDTPIYQYIFVAINNMVQDGADKCITVPEIESWLGQSSRGRSIYDAMGSKQTLLDACEMSEDISNNFDTAYQNLKRDNVIRDLRKKNFDTSQFYMFEDEGNIEKRLEINDKYNSLTAEDILNSVEGDLFELKNKYMKKDSSQSQTLFTGLEEMILGLEEYPEVGLPLQGSLFNHIVSGALTGRLYLRSGGSGMGKTRNAFADAAHFAFPIRYNWEKEQWERVGYNEKVLFIITEQDIDEIQKMAVAYITDVNESVYKRGLANAQQKKVLKEGIEVLRQFQDNMHVVRIPSPNIQLIKQTIREHVIRHDIRYVFYDYIFESPSLFAEFAGLNLRTDQMLFAMSDALKNLTVELDVFIMSSTQVNAKGDNPREIRNEAALAGSRAVINKADMGCIMARPTKEELKILEEITQTINITPNIVTDIYKLRGGEHTQVRIWSYMDLGTLKKKDLFVTNSRLEAVEVNYQNITFYTGEDEDEDRIQDFLIKLKEGKV